MPEGTDLLPPLPNDWAQTAPIVGVDGARGGWLAAVLLPDGEADLLLFGRFADLVTALPDDAVIAVDMPIGLPDRSGPKGRAPERLVRPLLGPRRSSVFSIPSRNAVYSTDYREGCALARQTSDSSRAFAKQAFHIFPKIREIDVVLRTRPTLCERIIEVHPELAFATLNAGKPMLYAKRKRIDGMHPGLDERRILLERAGLPIRLVESIPRGAEQDDALDALACLAVAARFRMGLARPYPDPPEHDSHGLPIAIWA
ncbi:DUF429 domain-containing protein [Notoacmeibacter marinus]|uniref:DUF429 domain-containing protein n=1 Tax=Notoacmeibacter marinus TaxID=1876515 RepID=UPI000DF33076|nr:DUF429 domain-containing protein [Notoacmeibacter marinus]